MLDIGVQSEGGHLESLTSYLISQLPKGPEINTKDSKECYPLFREA